MNKLRLFFIAGVFISWMTVNHANSSVGVVRFVGAIVEGACVVNINNTTANTECYRDGKNHTGTQTLANVDYRSKDLPLGLGTTEMRWLDQRKTQGVMTVVYR